VRRLGSNRAALEADQAVVGDSRAGLRQESAFEPAQLLLFLDARRGCPILPTGCIVELCTTGDFDGIEAT